MPIHYRKNVGRVEVLIKVPINFHEVLVAVQDETLKEESQRLASNSCHNNDFNWTLV